MATRYFRYAWPPSQRAHIPFDQSSCAERFSGLDVSAHRLVMADLKRMKEKTTPFRAYVHLNFWPSKIVRKLRLRHITGVVLTVSRPG